MVLYFTPIDPSYTIYMGKNKEENEDLIKYGLPEDIWFHVDKFSSAHVYLRLKKGETIENISEDVLEDCCQLVKANSIEGNKVNNITVVYTPWSNLKKTGGMDVGQVGFHSEKLVKKAKIEKRKNEIVNRLNKTKREEFPNLKELKEKYEKDERKTKKAALKIQQDQERRETEEKRKHQELMDYGNIMKEENMLSNMEIYKTVQEYEDDFM